MDRFTIAACAASVTLIGISAVAAWSPATETRPLAELSTDAPKEIAKAAESVQAACSSQYSLEDAGLDSADLHGEFERLAKNFAFAVYAPANFSRAAASSLPPLREFGWLETEAPIEDASDWTANGSHPATHDSENFDSERNMRPAFSETSIAEPVQTVRAGVGKLEDQVEYASVVIEQGEFVSVVAEPVEIERDAGSIDAEDLLSPDALAFFATMSMEQIEAYSRLAAMIRHPELAEGIMPLANAHAGGLPPLIPDGAADDQGLTKVVHEESPEWIASEAFNGDVSLMLGGDERTAVKVERGTVVGAFGEVDRIVKGESELAVLFKGGEEVLGPALNRPPTAPVLRPTALKEAQRR